MVYEHRPGRAAQAFTLLVAALSESCAALDAGTLKQYAADCQPWLVNIRRTLHSKPELMYEEYETSEYIRKALDKMNINHR